jgi:hypothetical protein
MLSDDAKIGNNRVDDGSLVTLRNAGWVVNHLAIAGHGDLRWSMQRL